MDDADAPKPNMIHSTGAAREYGFAGALIGGVTAYGWCVGTIVEALGAGWLDDGWVHLAFKRPMYPGDPLDVVVDDNALAVSRDGALCFEGSVGRGFAPWHADLALPVRREPVAAGATLPALTLANAPVGEDLAPMEARLDPDEAEQFARERERETLECFYGPAARVHPAWLAEQPIRLLHHSFDYGPSIHAQSRIQHLAPAFAGRRFVVSGRCTSAYERNGHHYIENDCLITADGTPVVKLRHVSIFRVRRRDASARSG
jgi:hypothetical protein